MVRTLLVVSLLLALGGCSSAVPDAVSDDEALDGVVTLGTGPLVSGELAESPAHDARTAFVRLDVLVDADAAQAVELGTSADGTTWSAWSSGTLDAEASDPASHTFVSRVDAPDGARFWRVRGAAGVATPTYLAVASRGLEDLAAESTLDVEGATTSVSEDVAGTTAALTSFHVYSFDAGKVGRSWLWLLRACRSRGWHGHLSGPRTGLRTYAQQLSLWNAFQNGTGAPAFPPWGPSRHLIRNVQGVGTWYQAVDTDDVATLVRVARGLGVSLHTPYLPREPWHVEAVRAFGPPRGWNP